MCLVRRRFSTCLIFIILAFTFSSSCAAVCDAPQPVKPNAEFFHSRVVFTGTVISSREVLHADRETEGWYYRLQVYSIFRGQPRQFITVYTSNDSVRMPLEVGRAYLLFAVQWPHHQLRIHNCGNAAELSQASEVLRKIEDIPKARGIGEVEGVFYRQPQGDASGIRVEV